MSKYLELDYIEVKQPIGTFYVTKIGWNDLLKIAEADIRKIEEENLKSNSVDTYLGIQREISEKRVKEIGQYVRTIDATFPTSIILSIPSTTYLHNGKEIEPNNYDNIDENIVELENVILDNGKLLIRKSEAIASILDGQHRLEGLKRGFLQRDMFNQNDEIFELNVTIFVDIDIDDQAQIFSVINKAQTKVNKSLVYDLYEYAKSRSPQKTAHDIARVLNRKENSPFKGKIKILGKAIDKDMETIAQATLVELVINYISKNPMEDRDQLKRKKEIDDSIDLYRYIFRKDFADKKDERILSCIWNYFAAIQKLWPQAWNGNTKGNVLNKTTGIVSFFRLLRDISNSRLSLQQMSTEEYIEMLKKIELESADFTRERYLPGSAGQSVLYHEIRKMVFPSP